MRGYYLEFKTNERVFYDIIGDISKYHDLSFFSKLLEHGAVP